MRIYEELLVVCRDSFAVVPLFPGARWRPHLLFVCRDVAFPEYRFVPNAFQNACALFELTD